MNIISDLQYCCPKAKKLLAELGERIKLAADDELGTKLQDAGLIPKERAPKKRQMNNGSGK